MSGNACSSLGQHRETEVTFFRFRDRDLTFRVTQCYRKYNDFYGNNSILTGKSVVVFCICLYIYIYFLFFLLFLSPERAMLG